MSAAKKTSEITTAEPEARPLTPLPQESNVFSAIERIMTDPNASVERANQAFEFYQRVEADKARKAFDAAMADARAEIKPVIKNQSVKYENKDKSKTDYDHENLADIAEAVDPILSKYGLSYRYRATSNPNEPVRVTCIVSHRLGHFEENTLSAGADTTGGKNSIQAIGSTVQYLMRYTLKTSLGLSVKKKDDDGKKADDIADNKLDADQLKAIRDLLDDTKTKEEAFLHHITKTESLEEVPAGAFESLKGFLTAKLKKQKAEQEAPV